MATSADIDIKWSMKAGSIYNNIDLIEALLECGWRFDYGDSYFYLPLGDEDFNWERTNISKQELLGVFRKKEQLGEIIGVAMVWGDLGIGGEFLFRNNHTFSVCLTINRKVVERGGYTNVEWYLDKLIPVLVNAQLDIVSIDFSEHI
ncbi:hypothetical protein [Hahella sp. HN01]|uniref:hypothetical protein n=1 Tax=Hahella sp. HN01 TaxID=2847262 RepID=UPI001C1ED69B|nr:hypothetical protein [Hahella sp. HN01]MBU6951600.1 hypothetical protein [Hahella sp. HN01]